MNTGSNSKPPASTNRAGPNTRARATNQRLASREKADVAMSSAHRSDSNKRRMGAAAAAYHANAAGFDSSSLTGSKPGDSDSLMQQLGSPEMLLKEL